MDQNQPILSLYIDQFDLQVSEPTYFVTYDIGFKRETYFDGSFGVLKKVIINILVLVQITPFQENRSTTEL